MNKIDTAFLTEQEAGMENVKKENFELAMLDDYVVLYSGRMECRWSCKGGDRFSNKAECVTINGEEKGGPYQ